MINIYVSIGLEFKYKSILLVQIHLACISSINRFVLKIQ